MTDTNELRSDFIETRKLSSEESAKLLYDELSTSQQIRRILETENITLRARVAELESQLESIRAFGSAPTTMELINALPDAIRDYIVSLLDTSGATEAYIKQLDEQLQTAQQQLAEARKLALSEAADTVSHMAGSGLHNHIEGYSLLRRCESEIRTLAAIEAAKGENNV